ncbi:MAG: gliding motility protein [Myxococcales bacterium]|nr:gliding motility protein [Myxococcales bacterium]
MSSVNLYTKEISLKIVYYGPGLGGKTSSLQYIHRAIKPDARGQLVSLSTGIDRTLYFDFLPVKLPKLRGYTVRVQLYTVPGQVHYNSTRKLVLTGADGIVFVADSQRARREANIESYQNLQDNLREQGLALERMPHLVQYNKRDMPDLMPVAELEAALNPHRGPGFETSAATGQGVFEALKSITTLVLSDLRRRGVWRAEAPAAGVEAQSVGAAGSAAAAGALASAVASELRDEPSHPHKTPTTDPSQSIASSLQALAEREQDPSPPALSPLEPEEKVVDGGVLARGAALSEILPPGFMRDAVVSVEYLVHRGDYAGAVVAAARTFNELARGGAAVGGGGPQEGPALYALMVGVSGDRYLRFRETAARSASGGASSADALFAIFFLVDVALRSD